MDYMNLNNSNSDFTNEDDFASDKIDQYSKEVSLIVVMDLND